MESVYSTLTTRALEKHQSSNSRLPPHQGHEPPKPRRTIIALAGPPGSGKSTVALAVANRLNSLLRRPTFAIVVPMDGFHLPRSALDALPNRAEAYARRGASWTFDGVGVLNLVTALHHSKQVGNHTQQPGAVILAPSFDHALKDPTLDAIRIPPEVEVVILEGNWLLLDEEPWCRISGLVDDTWFVDVDPGLARERIAKRHLRSGIEKTWEAAVRRAEGNDLRNGEEVRRRLVEPGVRVMSVDVPAGG